jgi:hypothetical protein
MDSQRVLYSKDNSDEFFTPEYAVRPLLKYIPKTMKIWCPFDNDDSNYVKVLGVEAGYDMVYSHIDEGQDFFEYEPSLGFDIIVSNPPFKNKRKFFERALSFGKPFALLAPCTWLNDKYSKWVFKEAEAQMQIMFFDKRIHFKHADGYVQKKTTFSSAYFCTKLLPHDIVLEGL